MTALLEKLVSIITPHHCIKCGIEDNILCNACASEVFTPLNPLCVLCEKPTVDWQTCKSCSRKAKLNSVWVAAEYSGELSEVIRLYKFQRVRAAHKVLAEALDSLLPYLDEDVVIVPVPTAGMRVRQRGYDHSLLLAKQLAASRKLELVQPIVRAGNARQVGADRKQRMVQAEATYGMAKPELVAGKQVWLVDDICTTGATLSAIAKLLKKAGASEVNGAVVAWQRLG